MIVDSHCHLADQAFVPDLEVVARRAEEAGVVAALCILSADEEEGLGRVEAVRRAWPAVQFAAGVHPHRAAAVGGGAAGAVAATSHAIETCGAVGLGEIGLDYHYDFAPRALQQDVFAAQVALAGERQ